MFCQDLACASSCLGVLKLSELILSSLSRLVTYAGVGRPVSVLQQWQRSFGQVGE